MGEGYGGVSRPAGGWSPFLHSLNMYDPSSPVEGQCLDVPATQVGGMAQKEALPTQTLITNTCFLGKSHSV